MRIEGSFEAPGSVDRVWALIRDPAVVGPLVPGCREVTPIDAEGTRYRAVVAITVGPISAKFNLDVSVIGEEPPREVRTVTRGEEGSRASTVSAESVLTLTPTENGATGVTYVSDVSVTGRLGKFGLGVMKKKAETLAREFAKNFAAEVAREADAAPAHGDDHAP